MECDNSLSCQRGGGCRRECVRNKRSVNNTLSVDFNYRSLPIVVMGVVSGKNQVNTHNKSLFIVINNLFIKGIWWSLPQLGSPLPHPQGQS